MLHSQSALYAVRDLKNSMISRIFSILLILSIFVSSFFSGIVRAYEAQFFLVSAYYSPLPGQSYYLQGSYEAEIRMNGRGTHGAS